MISSAFHVLVRNVENAEAPACGQLSNLLNIIKDREENSALSFVQADRGLW